MSKEGAAIKTTHRMSRKWLIVFGVLTLLASLSAVGYWYYSQQKAKADELNRFRSAELKTLNQQGYRGDTNLAVAYAHDVSQGDAAAAYSVYDTAINKQSNMDQKIALFQQAIASAVEKKQFDQALQYAIGLSKADNNYLNTLGIADIYKLKKDRAHEKEYVQKALNQLNSESHETPEYKTFAPPLEQRLAALGGKT